MADKSNLYTVVRNDYIGKKVNHKAKYGLGKITKQNDEYIFVKFESESEIKQFLYPTCFKSFLQLYDGEASEAAARANKEYEERKVKEKEIRQQMEEQAFERQIIASENSKSKKTVRVPHFSNIEDFYAEQERSLLTEINYLRNNGSRLQKLADGKLIGIKNNRFIYSFESDSELNLPDNTQIT